MQKKVLLRHKSNGKPVYPITDVHSVLDDDGSPIGKVLFGLGDRLGSVEVKAKKITRDMAGKMDKVTGGTKGNLVVLDHGGNANELPAGTEGQVLTQGENGAEWADAQGGDITPIHVNSGPFSAYSKTQLATRLGITEAQLDKIFAGFPYVEIDAGEDTVAVLSLTKRHESYIEQIDAYDIELDYMAHIGIDKFARFYVKSSLDHDGRFTAEARGAYGDLFLDEVSSSNTNAPKSSAVYAYVNEVVGNIETLLDALL